MSLNADYVTIAFHKDYSEYSQFMRDIREYPNVSIDLKQSFVIDLCGKNHLVPLSFHYVAEYFTKAERYRQTGQKLCARHHHSG